MIFGVSCPTCHSTSVRLGSPAEPSVYRFQCHNCATEWTARLPLEEVQRDELRAADPAPKRPRILILDDEPEVTAAVGTVLSDLGDPYTATTAAQALVLARVVQPDLAVIDVILPRMDGFDVVQSMRRIPGLNVIPVIFITGSDRIDIAVRAFEIGVATVLYKPLDEGALRDAAFTCLGRAAPS
jgi:CheY-like chemotaxis protein